MKRHTLSKEKIKILLLEGIHKNALDYFNNSNYYNIEKIDTALDENELIEKIKDVHIIGIRSRTQLTDQIIEQANKLFCVGCYSIGTNQVDLNFAKLKGIPVFNAPFSNTRSVAEMVIAETIMLMRGIPEKNAKAHNGEWWKTASSSYEVRGKTMGIIGYGHIGSQVSILAESLGMNVIFYDIEKKLNLGNALSLSSMDEVLSKADIVTVHVPLTEMNVNLIGKKQFSRMKRGAYFINASRGEVVDIKALADVIENKHLFGAAVDVFPDEPTSNQDEFYSELQKFDNVILTPHIGGSTQEAQANIGTEVTEKLVRYSDTGATIGATNFPQISLPPNGGKHRFLHIHHNVPGVMKDINDIFSRRNINISAQYLQTDAEIGYLIVDLDVQGNEDILDELKAVTHTIRARLLF